MNPFNNRIPHKGFLNSQSFIELIAAHLKLSANDYRASLPPHSHPLPFQPLLLFCVDYLSTPRRARSYFDRIVRLLRRYPTPVQYVCSDYPVLLLPNHAPISNKSRNKFAVLFTQPLPPSPQNPHSHEQPAP